MIDKVLYGKSVWALKSCLRYLSGINGINYLGVDVERRRSTEQVKRPLTVIGGRQGRRTGAFLAYNYCHYRYY